MHYSSVAFRSPLRRMRIQPVLIGYEHECVVDVSTRTGSPAAGRCTVTTAHGSRRSVLAGLLATLAVAACQPGTEPPPPIREPGRLVVSASVAGTPIATVVVEVRATDITSPLVFNLTLASGTASGTITVPAGSGRTIEVRAYDAAGILTHRGSRSGIEIREGASNPSISISVLSLGGAQPITVQLSSHSVTVTAGGPLTVAVGGTLGLTATVRDADGVEVIPGAGELQWATDAPAFASVSASGVVTGVMARSETVKIMATYLAVGGSINVTVTP
jgi:hypothetical protein